MNSIPLLLQYMVPGYLTIVIFQFSLSKKIDTKNVMIFSCVISYVLISLISLVRLEWLKEIPDDPIINSALAIIFGMISSCVISILFQRKWFINIIVKLFHKTFNDDIWRDVFDLDKGSNLKVYLKEKDYYVIGHLKNYEEKGNDSWLALNAFAKFDKETNKIYHDEQNYLKNSDVLITMRLSDVDYIEIF